MPSREASTSRSAANVRNQLSRSVRTIAIVTGSVASLSEIVPGSAGTAAASRAASTVSASSVRRSKLSLGEAAKLRGRRGIVGVGIGDESEHGGVIVRVGGNEVAELRDERADMRGLDESELVMNGLGSHAARLTVAQRP